MIVVDSFSHSCASGQLMIAVGKGISRQLMLGGSVIGLFIGIILTVIRVVISVLKARSISVIVGRIIHSCSGRPKNLRQYLIIIYWYISGIRDTRGL